MTVQTEGAHTGEHIISEAPGSRSREVGVVPASTSLAVAQIIAVVLTGSLTIGTPEALGPTANTSGLGTLGSLTADAGAPLGDYEIICIEPGSNAGAFMVQRPDGVTEHGVIGVAHNSAGGLNFTWADATDAVAGDGWRVSLTQGSAVERIKKWDPEGTDGTQHVGGVLYDAVVTVSDETKQAVYHRRDCEVNANLLAFDDSDDDAVVALAHAGLEALGIRAR